MARRAHLDHPSPSTAANTPSPDRWRWLDVALAAGCGALIASALLMPADANSAARGAAIPFSLGALVLGTFALGRRPAGNWSAWGPDLLLGATALWMCWSAARTTGLGDSRAAWNVAALWCGLAAWYSTVRTITAPDHPGGPAVRRALLVTVIAGAAGLTVHAWHQSAVSMPRDRASYQKDPERVLQKLGLDAPPGSLMRQRFEDRLNSTEPLATFALTNSLAGGLIAPFLICTALCRRAFDRRNTGSDRWPLPDRLLWGFLALAFASVLILTKSRTAIVAALLGLIVLEWMKRRSIHASSKEETPFRSTGRTRRLAIGGALVCAACLGLVLAWQGDRLVISEAPKSLAFRLQYWRSAARMIASGPWWGVGPGNFQSVYGQFREPTASEQIADPHQWWLEAAAAGGIPAGLLLTAAIGTALYSAFAASVRRPARPPSSAQSVSTASGGGPSKPPPAERPSHQSAITQYVVAVYLGASLAVPAVSLLGPAWGGGVDWQAWGWALPVSVLVAMAADRASRRIDFEDPQWLGWLAVAVSAVLLHLCGAGGLTVVGVAAPWWLWLAMATIAPSAEDSRASAASRPAPEPLNLGSKAMPLAIWGLRCAAVGGLFAVYTLCFRPVVVSQERTFEADRLVRFDAPTAVLLDAFQAAAAADPRDPDRVMQWQWAATRAVLERDEPSHRQALEVATAAAEQSDPRSAALFLAIGQRQLQLYQRWGRTTDLFAAAESCERAAERLPTGTLEAIQAASAVNAAWRRSVHGPNSASQRAAYERWAAIAQQLSSQSPHQDQRLDRVQIVAPLPSVLQSAVQRPVIWTGQEALANLSSHELVQPSSPIPAGEKPIAPPERIPSAN